MRSSLLKACFTLMAMLATALPALAQEPFIPPEFYDRTRPDFGNRLPLCVLPNSATLETDRAVAREIAAALLQEPEVVTLSINFDVLDGEGVWPDIFLALAERCVGVMGVELVSEVALPDWLTITRPYFVAPYVVVSHQDGIDALSDLEPNARIASPVFTSIDNNLLAMREAGGARADLGRLPYDVPRLGARLLEDGLVDAAIVWQPHLAGRFFDAAEAYQSVGTVAPLQADTREIGIVMRRQDGALRTLIDEAIATLEAPR